MTVRQEEDQMEHSTRTRNPGVAMGVTDPDIVLRFAREEPNPSAQGQMPNDDEHPSVASHTDARNRFEHWLKKMNTARKADRAGKNPSCDRYHQYRSCRQRSQSFYLIVDGENYDRRDHHGIREET